MTHDEIVCTRRALAHEVDSVQELAELGRGDIMIVVGGVIPPQDYEPLLEAGASEIFGPGTVIARAAVKLLEELATRLGHESRDE